jgi:hypothetical protein
VKAYLITTGTIFALVTLAHLARTPEIWSRRASDPWFFWSFALLTLISASMAVWAWMLWPARRQQP